MNHRMARIVNILTLSVYVTLSVSVLGMFIHPAVLAVNIGDKPLERLFDYIRLENKTSPLHPIGDFEANKDPAVHAANIEYLRNNNELLDKIRADLGDQKLHWQLKSLYSRLAYVPERRPEYITLYETYCRIVIGEILAQTELPDPYEGIYTLSEAVPSLPMSGKVCAYIVHNLSSEIRAEYEFQNETNQAVAVELSGSYFVGEVGSYSSFLSVDDNGNIDFARDRYTIWQNSAQNPYTALMTPVEETLHIAMRESTEMAIRAVLERNIDKDGKFFRPVSEIVDEWISIEEALVGGLVYCLLPPILEKQIGVAPSVFIDRDIETKSGFPKYRHLRQGIELVKRMGHKDAIKTYLGDPVAFRNLLSSSHI